uniref:Uncharacterized protein n=1 Tax=Anguilla anguilla TaxID=7936 RepID=A0A0E9RVZ8_ANGAN
MKSELEIVLMFSGKSQYVFENEPPALLGHALPGMQPINCPHKVYL